MKVQLSNPQSSFLFSKAKFPAYVGGRGAGKSFALTLKCILEVTMHNVDAWMCCPTNGMLHDITIPNMFKMLESLGLSFKYNGMHNEITLNTGKKIKFRSLQEPRRLVGSEVGFMGFDEIDTMDQEKADLAWQLSAACLRQKGGGNPQACVSTTPEGFNFVHRKWVKDLRNAESRIAEIAREIEICKDSDEIIDLNQEKSDNLEKIKDYKIYTAPTSANIQNLPADYLKTLRKIFPAHKLEAYLEGKFVNLESGAVYSSFNREIHHKNEQLNKFGQISIGCDFNVMKTCGVVFNINSKDDIVAVDEIVGCNDTRALVGAIKEKFPDRSVVIYPDASGASRSTNSSMTDISILYQAGFQVKNPRKNPFIKDRINCCNGALHQEILKVNTFKCPNLTDALEQQAYDKNGMPDKSSGHDHILDAMGYCVFQNSTLTTHKSNSFTLEGMLVR